MRHTTQLTAVLGAVLMLTSIGSAQTSQSTAKTPQTGTPANSVDDQPSAGTQENETPRTAPIFWITSAEVMRSTHAPQLDVIRVRGLASTDGWESIELVPLSKGVPTDGILDLMLIGEAPADNSTPTDYPTVEATFAIEPGHPFQGVRIHGAENSVTVKALPGYAEAATRPVDCSSCVGKYFLRKGEVVPADRAKETVVREEDLPHNLRVLRDSDGVGNLSSDPNRMTVFLDGNKKIVMAMWD
jgi:hypothetical protein